MSLENTIEVVFKYTLCSSFLHYITGMEVEDVNELLEKMEEERRKLNVLGQNAIEQSILLSESPEVQEQSRKLDELLALYQNMKAKRTEQML